MKPLYLFAATTLTLTGQISASAQDTVYFDITSKPADPQHANFFETKIQTDSGWTFADHWMNGKLKITGTIGGEDMKTRVGTFVYYDSTGVMRKRCKYAGRQNGPESDFYPEGQLWMEGNVEDGFKEGEWIAYYPSGKLKAKASFTDGKEASASFYHEDGSPDKSANIFFQESDYPGGSHGWLRFLNGNLRYPDKAINDNIQGTVYIQFMVAKDGKTSDFRVLHSANIYLDNEAMRVIRASGDWLPAIYAGTPMDSFKTQPIVFKLEIGR